jgi:hypothetical protein
MGILDSTVGAIADKEPRIGSVTSLDSVDSEFRVTSQVYDKNW